MRIPLLLAGLLVLASDSLAAERPLAPPFTATDPAAWINSPPLSLAGLRGKVVLLEFWTFGCSNCRNTLPWLETTAAEYAAQGLVVVAIHTPEFAHERVPANVARAVRELGIRYPVMLDPDFAYWNLMNNRYWPAFYLVDRQGRIAATAIGELHDGQPRAERFEAQLRALLASQR
jgi:thiol-disulfide isomerase/thioredoxin